MHLVADNIEKQFEYLHPREINPMAIVIWSEFLP